MQDTQGIQFCIMRNHCFLQQPQSAFRVPFFLQLFHSRIIQNIIPSNVEKPSLMNCYFHLFLKCLASIRRHHINMFVKVCYTHVFFFLDYTKTGHSYRKHCHHPIKSVNFHITTKGIQFFFVFVLSQHLGHFITLCL